MKASIKFIITAAIAVASCIITTDAQIASNPPYTLNQSVIATGGGTSAGAGNVYTVEGTIGQPAAGKTSTNTPFAVRSGFFTPAPFGPTVATAIVGGRILTADGIGIRNASITLAGGSGLPLTARSSSFGYFTFEDVPVGVVYILSVSAKQFQFSQNIQVISVSENITDINFIANP